MVCEEEYKSIYGDLIGVIDVNFAERNIYPTMQKAKALIAGFSTTCLVEAFSFGKKVLYANFCGTNKYHKDFANEIVFEGNKKDESAFYKRIDVLISQSNEEFFKDVQNLKGYYVADPRVTKTREYITNQIFKIINSPSSCLT